MHGRCKPGRKRTKYWAGRGITVCAEWATFAAFKTWAEANGYRKGMSLDRIHSRGNYVPSNCEWVTRGENSKRAFQVWRQYNHTPIEMLWGAA